MTTILDYGTADPQRSTQMSEGTKHGVHAKIYSRSRSHTLPSR
ncbi:hypothetical protein MY5147_009029 [Beauveria neobassiana]